MSFKNDSPAPEGRKPMVAKRNGLGGSWLEPSVMDSRDLLGIPYTTLPGMLTATQFAYELDYEFRFLPGLFLRAGLHG
jgi:hypothetical protein